MSTKPTQPQSIEELRTRYEGLNAQKITAEANRKTAQMQLDELKADAKSKWGTDNLDELRQKFKEMEDDNERKRRDYQQKLDQIEAELKEVDQKFAQAQEKK